MDLPDNRYFEDKIINNEFIFSLLSTLKEDEKEIVTLHIYGELTHVEIAETLSMPYPKVRWKYAYALKKLRNTLAKYDALGGVVHEKQ